MKSYIHTPSYIKWPLLFLAVSIFLYSIFYIFVIKSTKKSLQDLILRNKINLEQLALSNQQLKIKFYVTDFKNHKIHDKNFESQSVNLNHHFATNEERAQYFKYLESAINVYPYAAQAVAVYEVIEQETNGMNRHKQKRYIRHEFQELKGDMTERLKNLSKTEGKVLVKMIERELNMPFYDVIRATRGTTTATYWNTLGILWGYDLKEGYQPGEDPILDYAMEDTIFLYGNVK